MPNARCPGPAQFLDQLLHPGVREAAALHVREAVADQALNSGDRSTERREILLEQRGERAHQYQVGYLADRLRWRWSELSERLLLRGPAQTPRHRRDRHDTAPLLRDRVPEEQRCLTVPVGSAALDDEPAPVEEPGPDP